MSRPAPDWSDPARVAVQSMALAGFLHWIVGNDKAWAAFTAETGMKQPPAPRTALDRMIDDATGAVEIVLRHFIAWAINTQWGGIDEVPPDMRGLCAAPGEAA